MTPPRRTIATVAPTVSPSFSSRPRWCSVARVTVTPESATGSTSATGVMVPVRATLHSTPRNTLVPSSPWNFQATAHRGWCAVAPRRACSLTWFATSTTPSVS